MSTLYEIDKSIAELLENGFNEDCVDDETGEIDFKKGAALLEQFQADRSVKLENIALFIKNLDADVDALKAEEKALKARREAKERKAESLKSYIAISLINDNVNKFETPKCVVSFRKSVAVNITNEEALPVDYVVATTTYKPDKTAIKKALQGGADVPGAVLEEKQNLQIK